MAWVPAVGASIPLTWRPDVRALQSLAFAPSGIARPCTFDFELYRQGARRLARLFATRPNLRNSTMKNIIRIAIVASFGALTSCFGTGGPDDASARPVYVSASDAPSQGSSTRLDIGSLDPLSLGYQAITRSADDLIGHKILCDEGDHYREATVIDLEWGVNAEGYVGFALLVAEYDDGTLI